MIYLWIITNNYSYGYENDNISNEGVKELGVNISKLTNLTHLNLNLKKYSNNNDLCIKNKIKIIDGVMKILILAMRELKNLFWISQNWQI